jgi:hypothetical protein
MTKGQRLQQENSHNVGQRIIHGLGIVYMILVQNSQDQNSKRCYKNCHIRDVCTTAKNPQFNAVCERMHQTVGNVLRTLLHGNSPQNIANAAQYVDKALSVAMHAMRAGVHSTLGSSPGILVFNRDMFLNIQLIADWHVITQRQKHLIHEKLMRENQKRRGYDYDPQQLVLKKKWKPKKLSKRTSGLYKIEQVHINGTVTIQLRPGLTERVNIR